MDDFSDDSGVNPEEMARMVEDLNDLDNDLLGGSANKRDTVSSINGRDKTTDGKKKVAFKSDYDSKFDDDDDPLADPLSDDEYPYDRKKSSLASAKSNLVADLFGLKNPKPAEKISEPPRPQNTTETQKIEQPREKNIFETTDLPIRNDHQKTANSGLSVTAPIVQNSRSQPSENSAQSTKVDAPKLTSNKARKMSLMEDLLGASRPTSSTREIDAASNFSKIGLENPAASSKSEPQKSEPPQKSSAGYGFDLSNPREPRRGRRNSPIISDPLGLFATPAKQPESSGIVNHIATKSEIRSEDRKLPENDLPEWLGGSAKSRSAKSEGEKQTARASSSATSEIPPTVISSSTSLSNPHEPFNNFIAAGSSSQTNQQISVSYPDMSMLIGAQFDQQAAIISMQQQENELRTATTMSRQNDNVSKIVEMQRAKLDEQEKMFNSLIKRQIERQSMLETQMKIQQSRIDHYIQTLMAQPTSMPTLPFESKSASELQEEAKMESPECLVKQLQLENVCLENTLAILKEKQEKEIAILEASYEKQISFMRVSMEKFEKRIQQDNEALEADYEKKLDKLKEEKNHLELSYQEEIESLKKKEKLLVEEIHSRHCRNVELLEKEHADTIGAISRAKELERKAVDSITANKTDLGNLFDKSKFVIESFQSVQKKIEDRDEQFDEIRCGYSKKQEDSLQLLRAQLKLQQEALANERKMLIDVSQKLDTATNELTSEFRKKSSTINETEDRLASREKAFLREKQLADEQMNWERQHVRAMKDAWTKEQERQMKMLSEEREVIAIEKSKLEVLNKLKSGSDDMVKVELEVALKTAQEAANEANQERRKWQERSRALEEQKRALQEKETQLTKRAKELEDLTQSALMKREEGVQAFREAQRIELKHKERSDQLQMQLESLAERENKIATEKLSLARERLATRFEEAEKPEKGSVAIAPTMHYDRSFLTNSHVSTHFRDIVDPHLLLLKLNLDNKLDASNELLSAMQVISQ